MLSSMSRARVLQFVIRGQTAFVRSLDAQEHAADARGPHQSQELGIVGQVERGFGGEVEWMAVRVAPLRNRRQQDFGARLVANEIVVDDEHSIAPARRVQLVELGQHLRDGFRARTASIDFDDVAELAVERAAARVLHRHGAVALHPDQTQVGQRAARHGGPLGGLVHGTRRALLQVASQFVHQVLGLADHHMVGMQLRRRQAAGDGTAHHRLQPTRMAAVNDGHQALALHVHTADHGDVGPREVGVRQPLDVGIDQALVPVRGQQRGNGHQAQRRLGGALADQRYGKAKAPISVGSPGIDQQRVHRIHLCRRPPPQSPA